MALPPTYDGRNSVKDLAQRAWDVEGTKLPAVQADVQAVEQQMEEELDLPDLTLILANALV